MAAASRLTRALVPLAAASSDDSWSLEKLFLATVHLRLGDSAQAQLCLSEADTRMDHMADRVSGVERAQFALVRTQAREVLEGVHSGATAK